MSQKAMSKERHVFIGKKDYLLYAMTFYGANGKKLSGFELDNVKLDANLDDKLFEVPKECKIFIAKTQDEWLKLSSIAKNRDDMRLDENLKKSLEGYYKKYYGTVDMDELLNNVKGDENWEIENTINSGRAI